MIQYAVGSVHAFAITLGHLIKLNNANLMFDRLSICRSFEFGTSYFLHVAKFYESVRR